MKNTGKPTEARFEASIAAAGKAAYCYRVKDAAAIRGITGKVGAGIDATPSDYICAVKGQTFFCEVKSTNHATLFEFSMFRKGQNSHATQIIAAGGNYLVLVHRVPTDDWFLAAKSSFIAHEAATGRKSMTWIEMEKFRCSTETTPAGTRPRW